MTPDINNAHYLENPVSQDEIDTNWHGSGYTTLYMDGLKIDSNTRVSVNGQIDTYLDLANSTEFENPPLMFVNPNTGLPFVHNYYNATTGLNATTPDVINDPDSVIALFNFYSNDGADENETINDMNLMADDLSDYDTPYTNPDGEAIDSVYMGGFNSSRWLKSATAQFTLPITVTFLARYNATHVYGDLISFGDATATGGVKLYISSNSNYIGIINGDNSGGWRSTSSLLDGTVAYLSAVITTTGYKLYREGSLLGQGTGVYNLNAALTGLTLGADSNGANSQSSNLGIVRIHNRELTPAEIIQQVKKYKIIDISEEFTNEIGDVFLANLPDVSLSIRNNENEHNIIKDTKLSLYTIIPSTTSAVVNDIVKEGEPLIINGIEGLCGAVVGSGPYQIDISSFGLSYPAASVKRKGKEDLLIVDQAIPDQVTIGRIGTDIINDGSNLCFDDIPYTINTFSKSTNLMNIYTGKTCALSGLSFYGNQNPLVNNSSIDLSVGSQLTQENLMVTAAAGKNAHRYEDILITHYGDEINIYTFDDSGVISSPVAQNTYPINNPTDNGHPDGSFIVGNKFYVISSTIAESSAPISELYSAVIDSDTKTLSEFTLEFELNYIMRRPNFIITKNKVYALMFSDNTTNNHPGIYVATYDDNNIITDFVTHSNETFDVDERLDRDVVITDSHVYVIANNGIYRAALSADGALGSFALHNTELATLCDGLAYRLKMFLVGKRIYAHMTFRPSITVNEVYYTDIDESGNMNGWTLMTGWRSALTESSKSELFVFTKKYVYEFIWSTGDVYMKPIANGWGNLEIGNTPFFTGTEYTFDTPAEAEPYGKIQLETTHKHIPCDSITLDGSRALFRYSKLEEEGRSIQRMLTTPYTWGNIVTPFTTNMEKLPT